MTSLDWRVVWETSLSPSESRRIGELLARVFPDDASRFADGRAWAGARPELRLVGSTDGRPLAHLGIARRLIRSRSTGHSVPVGDTGLVGVDPDARGQGLGAELLTEAGRLYAELGVAFGVLTCLERVVPFYRAGGFVRAQTPVLHDVDLDDRVRAWTGPLMLYPVAASLDDWPDGELERNAREI